VYNLTMMYPDEVVQRSLREWLNKKSGFPGLSAVAGEYVAAHRYLREMVETYDYIMG